MSVLLFVNFFSKCLTWCWLTDLENAEELYQKRITRILTSDFPHYFAVVTRVRQESNTVGPNGGMITSTVIPQVKAMFSEGALTKHIKVGLQVCIAVSLDTYTTSACHWLCNDTCYSDHVLQKKADISSTNKVFEPLHVYCMLLYNTLWFFIIKFS